MASELYRHTQPGTAMRWILGSFTLLPAGMLVFFCARPNPVGLPIMAWALFVMLLCLWLFHSLTTVVTDEALEVSFGPGLIRRKFPLGEIVSCRAVRSSWYHGWGIHKISGGWLYNVSGFDAVEVVLRDGRKAWIGTDAPQELAAVIGEYVKAREG